MKKFLSFALLAAALCFGATSAHAQCPVTVNGPAGYSRLGNNYYAIEYSCWRTTLVSGNSATGSQTVFAALGVSGTLSLPDGRQIQPFATNVPVTFDLGTNAETVTPSAVGTPTACPNGYGICVAVTATFSNTHGIGSGVASGDNGIFEAINDAGSTSNGGMVWWTIDPGIVTLNTGGANTNLGSVQIPARSVVTSATARVTTTIATCAGGWSLGWSTGTEFTAANTTLTAGTTTDSSTITQPAAVNAATIPINKCTTSNASAGAIHPHFEGYKIVAPLS